MSGLSADQQQTFFGWVTELVHAHRGRLARVVQREGVRASDALDCVQEAFVTFLALPQARLLVGSPEDSARLLVILARNIARNRRRRHDYARSHVDPEELGTELSSASAPADEIVELAEQQALALGCIATLNEVQRAVVRLRLIDEVPGEDVARQLGTSAAHVAVLLHRAKQRLQGCLTSSGVQPAAQAGGSR